MSRGWRIVLVLSLVCNLAIVYVAYKALEYRSHINEFLDKYTEVVDEFSQREVYAEANRPLKSEQNVPGRVVFFGTQVTESWPLAENFVDYEAINRGVAGQRVSGLLLRFWQDVIELCPQAVVIEVSSYNFRSNSSPAEIAEYVKSMAHLAKSKGIVPILMTVTPPTADFEVFEQPEYAVKDTVVAYNDWLRMWAEAEDIVLIDAYEAVSGNDGFLDPQLASSRVDLNSEGYERVSEMIREALKGL